MTDLITMTTITSLKTLFQKKPERNVIIDPFCCLIKLSLLRFLDSGTKISIYQNRIHFNQSGIFQGFIRTFYGDNREHLHNLYMPIKKCVEWFWNDKNGDMLYMFNNAVIGLKMLKNAYGNYDTIQHTLNYFIIILMQKNPSLIGKLGIKSLDIDVLTTDLLAEDTPDMLSNKNTNTNNNTNANTNINTSGDGVNGNVNNKKKNKNNTTSEESPEPIITSQPNVNPNITINTQSNISIQQQAQKDMHKFLSELWNQREMNIVINLYKEMEAKTNIAEKEHIYTNIMNYCAMKEDILHEYIEKNSSVLQ